MGTIYDGAFRTILNDCWQLKGVGNIMGGALIETSARTILNQGISQNQKETALRMLKRGKMTIEEMAEVERLAGLQTV